MPRYRKAKAELGWTAALKAFNEKARVRGRVSSAIKGGFLVDVGGVGEDEHFAAGEGVAVGQEGVGGGFVVFAADEEGGDLNFGQAGEKIDASTLFGAGEEKFLRA